MLVTKIEQVSKNKRKKIKEYLPTVKFNKTAIKLEEIEKSTISTSNGVVFDADENSQLRMLRALEVMRIRDKDTIYWTLATGEVKEISKDELEEAFCLACENHYNIWLG